MRGNENFGKKAKTKKFKFTATSKKIFFLVYKSETHFRINILNFSIQDCPLIYYFKLMKLQSGSLLNHYHHSEYALMECLPKGWRREEVMRQSGLSTGKTEVYYLR